jgi:hypothetical protein
MDQLISSILPTTRIGQDGFSWWVGQIEGTARDETNNKGGYRFKVRIVGDHPGDPEILPTEDLPWANVVMPVTVPFVPGNAGGAHPQLEVGCWVIGFYMDTEKQKPIIMGSIGQTPGATKVFVERTPDTKPFVTAIGQINPKVDGSPKQKGTDKNTATGGLPDGTKDGDGNARVNVSERKVNPLKNGNPYSEEWCQSIAEKCDNIDIKTQMSNVLAELLAAVQSNGGNIGTYLVNQATGKINEGVGIARNYINKAVSVVREFVARVKGFVIEKLTAAVKDLIQALLFPSETGNALTPVTEWFNNLLKNLGCQMSDLGDRLAKWLTNVLMSFIEQIYRAAACQVDKLVNGIISKMNSLMEDLLESILGPLQEILGAIAGPLNLIGGAINFVMQLLGITCSGPDKTCSKYKQVCTSGEEKEKENDRDFLDNLLGEIDNLFPATGADYTQYTCDEAYTGRPLEITTVGFVGGIPLFDGGDGTIPGASSSSTRTPGSETKRITYNIEDITVEEGEDAIFTVTRSGYLGASSSVRYKTVSFEDGAEEDVDYLKTSDILGFAPGESRKTISVKTFYDTISEGPEDFSLVLRKNSPVSGSGVSSKFTKNIAICTITERNVRDRNRNPYGGTPLNPTTGIENTFPTEVTDLDGDGINDSIDTDITIDDPNTPTTERPPRYFIRPDKNIVREGEFVTYTIETQNVENGTILYYTLLGNDIEPSDIIGGYTTGNFTINSGIGKVTVGIEDDGVVEDFEIMRFSINGTGSFADVTIVQSGEDPEDADFDEGEGDTPETEFENFRLPVVNSNEIITDENGGIISIPVSNPGSPYAEPPYVFVGGEGIGATASALLDSDGFVTEIRVKSSGYGYKKNLQQEKNLRCIIDTFTLIRPGEGYTEAPKVYVNDQLGVAEAIINDDGFVIGARVLDRQRVYEKMPRIIIVGGNGFGAKLMPSLVCLDNQALSIVGATKIGTGRYVDCP